MRKHITYARFTNKFVNIMTMIGIKTIGQAHSFLNACNPHVKIQDVRVNYLKKELDLYIKNNRLNSL